MMDRELQVHFGPTHYYLRAACIATKNPEFDATNDMLNTARSFKEPHKRLIYAEFKLCNEQADIVIFCANGEDANYIL